MIGGHFQTPEITKPEKCCENLIKMQNKIVEFEFSDDKICLIELVKIKLVSALIKLGSCSDTNYLTQSQYQTIIVNQKGLKHFLRKLLNCLVNCKT